MHYLAEVVQAAVQEYAGDRGLQFLEVPLEAEGPAPLTSFRWVAMAERPDIKAWLEQRLLAHSSAWRDKLALQVDQAYLRPAEARPFAWEVLRMARCLAELKSSPMPICFLQLAKLSLAV